MVDNVGFKPIPSEMSASALKYLNQPPGFKNFTENNTRFKLKILCYRTELQIDFESSDAASIASLAFAGFKASPVK
jgi:hypothetical protein